VRLEPGMRLGPTIRARAPRVEIGEELSWVMRRSFGPTRPGGGGGVSSPERVERLATALGLGSRIVARCGFEVICDELGAEVAEKLRQCFIESAAQQLIYEEVLGRAGRLADSLGTRVIVLKGVALHALGRSPFGGRPVSDLDLLVVGGKARLLQAALIREGWRERDMPEGEQHLPGLIHSAGARIEIHLVLRGVYWPGSSEALSATRLLSEGLCVPDPGGRAGVLVPCDDVLVAHAIVHALVQHGYEVGSYPVLRILSDLQDIGWGRSRLGAFMRRGYRWISGDVAEEEVRGLFELVWSLQGGGCPARIAQEDSPAGRMLRHLVGVLSDRSYQKAVRLLRVVSPVPARKGAAQVLRVFRRNLWITAEQAAAAGGRPPGGPRLLLMRVTRPLALLAAPLIFVLSWVLYRFGAGRSNPGKRQ